MDAAVPPKVLSLVKQTISAGSDPALEAHESGSAVPAARPSSIPSGRAWQDDGLRVPRDLRSPGALYFCRKAHRPRSCRGSTSRSAKRWIARPSRIACTSSVQRWPAPTAALPNICRHLSSGRSRNGARPSRRPAYPLTDDQHPELPRQLGNSAGNYWEVTSFPTSQCQCENTGIFCDRLPALAS